MILANRADPVGHWDSMQSATAHVVYVVGSIYGPGNVVRRCRDNVYEVCPNLATKWESNADFTEWTFTLRNDVRWHDGTPFTPEDVKFWAELAFFGAKIGDKTRLPVRFKGAFGDLKSVEVLPENRVKFVLSKPAFDYLSLLSHATLNLNYPQHLMGPSIKRGEVEVTPRDVNLVGTGPYRFQSHQKGGKIEFRRFDGYWGKDEQGRKLPYLDGIDFAIIPSPSAMDAAFRVGRLDGGALGDGGYLSKERKQGYVKDLGVKVWFAELGTGGGGLTFNVLKPSPLQDVRVRRAISLWIEKQDYSEAVQGGFGYLSALLGPSNPFTSPDFMTWPGFNPVTRDQDRAEAKRLMAEAGYANGFSIDLACRREGVEQCEFLHAQLRGLKIDLSLTLLDQATHEAVTNEGRFLTNIGGVSTETDPTQAELQLTVASRSPGARMKHEDQRVVEYFDRFKRTANREEQVRIWRELERYFLLEKVYTVPLGGKFAVVPFRSHVKGLVPPAEVATYFVDFSTVWLDK